MDIFDKYTEKLVKIALGEDIGKGDITTDALTAKNFPATAELIANEPFVTAGLDLVDYVFKMVDPLVITKKKKQDGDSVQRGDVIAVIRGGIKPLMKAERTALNFISRLSGIATLTSEYVNAVRPYGTRIMATRKTTPGWRILEKYAVTIGGGESHRMGLYDQILIKDNHLKLFKGKPEIAVKKAIQNAKQKKPEAFVIVEIDDPRLVTVAKDNGADRILLDNMGIEELKTAVALAGGAVELEASGGLSLANIRKVAGTGVDIISIGKITHSAASVDITMEIKTV
ncbi:carboxylating nicotinate-nucleotide diphosphorylase [bacterium]|jgi:nicotinate-nucleotide pyrophosphorylase (carboxylating)|nr:carboxylating nicotinate-nucleotide diphosphorylase [bacterium]